MVDFNLSNSEQQTRAAARSFAAAHLAGAQAIYSDLATPEERFQSLRPIYAAAVKANLIKAQVPAQIGGSSTNLVEAAILVEEFYAVEASASLTIFGTGLGLTPVALAHRPSIQKFLDPFLASEGAPLASLVFSEPAGVVCFLPSFGFLHVYADHFRQIGWNLERLDCKQQHAGRETSGF
jgi:alkylation response protein AidB-like acyl-CoA dehydrogenase